MASVVSSLFVGLVLELASGLKLVAVDSLVVDSAVEDAAVMDSADSSDVSLDEGVASAVCLETSAGS
jgi:hypothetical protein